MAKADYICCEVCDTKIVYDHDNRIEEALIALGFNESPVLCRTCRGPAPEEGFRAWAKRNVGQPDFAGYHSSYQRWVYHHNIVQLCWQAWLAGRKSVHDPNPT